MKARLLSQVLWYACSRLLICNDAVLVLQLLAMSCCWWRGWQDSLAWFWLCVFSLLFLLAEKAFSWLLFSLLLTMWEFLDFLVWFRVQKIAIENQSCCKWNTLVAWKNCFLESFGLSHKQNSVKTNDSILFSLTLPLMIWWLSWQWWCLSYCSLELDEIVFEMCKI